MIRGGAASPEDSSSVTLPLAGTSPTPSSSPEGPASPPTASESIFENDATKSSTITEVESLRLLLQEVRF